MTWVLALIAIILLTRLFLVKREIRSIAKQLREYNEFQSGKQIDVQFVDKSIEELAYEVNRHLQISDKMVVAQKKSEDELKRAVAYISHDLRTPLTTILGCIQIIEREGITEERKNEYIQMAGNRGAKLQELLNEFFSLSTVESPDYKLNLEYLNLNNIFYDIIAGFYDRFVDKNIEPEVEVENSHINIVGDTIAINRILENILSNVIKYTEGEVKISLKKEKQFGVVRIQNYTEKLSEKDVERIFDKFYIGDKSRKADEVSTGLGLAISKILIEKLNGSIQCTLNDSFICIECRFPCVKQD